MDDFRNGGANAADPAPSAAAALNRARTRDGLARALSPTQCVALVVGTLIGTGVFLVPREMIAAVHSPGWILLVWVVGGLLSLFGALAYAELGTLRPEAGGEYAYLRDGWGPGLGFLFGWGMFWLIRPASVATIAAGLARAVAFIWPQLDAAARIRLGGLAASVSGAQLLAAGVIGVVTLINYFGVRKGGWVQTIFTALKLLLLAGLILAAFFWARGSWSHLRESLAGRVGAGGFGAALVAALWAYDGWSDLTLAGSEIQDPERTIPRAMIYGMAIVFIAYAAINLAYFYVLSPARVAASDNVAASMAAQFLGRHAGALVSAAVAISAFATLNSSILSGARAPFALARDGLFWNALAKVHPRHRTPHVSLWTQAVFAAALALTGTFAGLFTLTIFAEWLFYALAVSALFVFRRRGERSPYRSFGYPVVPGLFLLVAVVLLVQTFRSDLRASSLGLLVILAGIPFYLWRQRRAARLER